MSELTRGAFVPLFDRLSTADTNFKTEPLLTPEQLQSSIARDLSRLLNTRSSLLVAEYIAQAGTTLDYGMPDISALSAKSDSDLAVLQTLVTHAIQCFEPRLNHVDVKAFASTKFAGGVVLIISGVVTIGLMLRQLNFELQVDQRQTTRVGVA
jgi:type VI secretion system lysozyme-like protein